MATASTRQRTVYGGSRRKLVLAFDIGTTFSGVSYSILDPGQVPEIKGVTRFPAHEHIRGESKIPTVIYYDRAGNVRAIGAEAVQEGVVNDITLEEGWVKSEWFKLHIRPKSGSSESNRIANSVPPLPPGKTVVQVLADFLLYLTKCTQAYIQTAHASGRDLWDYVASSGNIDYVLSHPNGWEGYQQSQLRDALVLAGLVPDVEQALSRVSFVTEGEASLHFAIDHGLAMRDIQVGDGVVIVDAGGGTIDVCAYRKTASSGIAFEEMAVPQCHFHGSVFVSVLARLFLEDYLKGSEFYDDIDHIVRCFDKSTKVRFRSDKQPQYVKFGGTRDNDASCNIRFGQLKLEGPDVARFFEPSINCIVESVRDQVKSDKQRSIKHVILVGGFSASDWLLEKVDEALRPLGLNVIRPDSHVNKAVSDGAVSFYLNRLVKARISKVAYGTFASPLYDPNNDEHRKRQSSASYTSVSGERRIRGFFQAILPKNTPILEDAEFRCNFVSQLDSKSKDKMKTIDYEVWCYKGSDPDPRWKDTDPGNFVKLCTVQIDTSRLPFTRKPSKASRKELPEKEFWFLSYSCILSFSGNELHAQMAWMDPEGIEKRSPAKIVYEPNDR